MSRRSSWTSCRRRRQLGERPPPGRRRRAGAARGAGRSGQAAAGARPARLERGQVLAGRRHRHGRRRAARATRSRSRSPTRGRDPGVRARADLREVLPQAARRGQRHGPRALHRAGPRHGDGRQNLGRLGGGTRVSVRVRTSRSHGMTRCEFRRERDNELNVNARAGDRRRSSDPAALPGQPRGGRNGGARGRRRPERAGHGAGRTTRRDPARRDDAGARRLACRRGAARRQRAPKRSRSCSSPRAPSCATGLAGSTSAASTTSRSRSTRSSWRRSSGT